MGTHFDALVELLKSDIHENETDDDLGRVREFFSSLVDRFTLFELPMQSNGIRPKLEADLDEYVTFLQHYLCKSQEYGSFLLTPFPRTAIEDSESVVFMQPLGERSYRVSSCRVGSSARKDVMVQVADVDIRCCIDTTFKGDVEPIYVSHWVGRNRYTQDNCHNLARNGNKVMDDVGQSVVSYIEQVTYIMHPSTFLVRKESAQSRSLNGKSKKPRKTINRPHFICLSKEDLEEFWRKRRVDDIRMVHPVEAFWRTLCHERYTKPEAFVRQHLRGTGEMYGKEGMHYQIYIKIAPDRIVPYTRETAILKMK